MIKNGRIAVFIAALIVGSSAFAAEQLPTSEPVTVKMAYEAGSMLPIFTKSRILDQGLKIGIRSDLGEIKVNGTATKLQATFDPGKKLIFLGLDTNGDGNVNQKEFMPAVNGMCGFRYKTADGCDCQLVFENMAVNSDKSGVVMGITGAYYPNYCMKGALAGQTLRLVDEDMSGSFTQDGNDGIVIGNTNYAVPLYSTHLIGGKYFKLEVASNGSSVTVTPLPDVKTGLVEAPLLVPATKTLVMVDQKNGCSVDLIAAVKSGVPEGTYSFCYAVIISGANSMSVTPTLASHANLTGTVYTNSDIYARYLIASKKAITPDYPIKADMINVLTLGPPFKLYFNASSSVDKITVQPTVFVFGSGNEYYNMRFSSGGKGTPLVTMLNGKEVLSKENMEFG